jgi:hypothetical protein
MADNPYIDTPPADEAPDPDEAELVAYLDGELDAPAARRLEDRMAADPDLRARAAALKKTFDLLDYLPRPEPSATFATRTLDRLPAVRSGSGVVAAPSAPSGLAISSTPSSLIPAPSGGRSWGWAAGVVAAVGVALGAGYLAAGAARDYLFPPRKDANPDALGPSDIALVKNLPFYVGVDDADFLRQLDDLRVFEDVVDGSLPPDPSRPAPDPPWAKSPESLVQAFRELPPERQQQIRKLDQELHDPGTRNRDRLWRVLEAYAAWLDRLPDAERRAVLAAGTPRLRLERIRELREQQWFDSLPEKIRTNPDPGKRAELVKHWKEEEARRREAWADARLHWDPARADKLPWPFDDQARKQTLEDYVRVVFKTDALKATDRPRCRLSDVELERLRDSREAAEKLGGWAWYGYGKTVYHLTQLHPMLPEPATGKPVLDVTDLWPAARDHYRKKKFGDRLTTTLGRWPEFAQEVHRETFTFGKQLQMPKDFQFGPSRPAEFKESVRQVVAVLERKATADERKQLHKLEGQWPEYPKELVRLARVHDLEIPGVTLPGSPRMWEHLYNPPKSGQRPGK